MFDNIEKVITDSILWQGLNTLFKALLKVSKGSLSFSLTYEEFSGHHSLTFGV